MTKRFLKENEILDIISFLKPNERLPKDVADNLLNTHKDNIKEQLKKIKIYEEMIPELKKEIENTYEDSLIQPGESVGVIKAQSIGEKQTQTNLNSFVYETEIIVKNKEGSINKVQIGEFVEINIKLLEKERLEYDENNDNTYGGMVNEYEIHSCDENGNVSWKRIEGVSRHPVINEDGSNTMIKITTKNQREVIGTKSKSFLKLINGKIIGVNGSELKLNDYVPISKKKMYFEEKFELNCKDMFLEHKLIDKELEMLLMKKIDIINKVNGSKYNNGFYNVSYNYNPNKYNVDIEDVVKLDYRFGYLIGAYLSTGSMCNNIISFQINNSEYFELILDFCKDFNIFVRIYKSFYENGIDRHYIDIHNIKLSIIFKKLCGNVTKNRCLSDKLVFSNKEFILGFLKSYLEVEGYMTNKGDYIIVSYSKYMLVDIQHMLNYFDIYGFIKVIKVDKKKNNQNFVETIINNIEPFYKLKIKGKQIYTLLRLISKYNDYDIIQTYEINKYEKIIPDEINNKIIYKERKEGEFKDILFDKIVKIENVDNTSKYAYDLTVSDTRNFNIYNGLAVRDTFHTAGSSDNACINVVTTFSELLNTSKDVKNPMSSIYFKYGNTSLEELRHTIGSNINEITIKIITKDYNFYVGEEKKEWYEVFFILYPDKPNFELNDCISVDVDMNKLYMYGITLKNLADSIIDKYDNNDIFCVFSPDCIGVIDIYVNSNNILLPKQRILYVDEENAIDIFLEEIVWNEIQNIILFGIPNIKEFYFLKDKDTWMIETIGSNLQKLLTLPFIDETKTKSTNLWDIYNILGIEAARQFLIDQFLNIMGGINIAHPTLLADKMTFTGIPVSMSRYTMRNEDSATFQKISFEETIDNIIHSATFGQIETTNGVSASIICGKRSKIGTGLCDVKLDIDKLISFSDNTTDESNKNNIFFENDTSDNSDYD